MLNDTLNLGGKSLSLKMSRVLQELVLDTAPPCSLVKSMYIDIEYVACPNCTKFRHAPAMPSVK